MRLHRFGWVVVSSLVLMTPPAFATSTGEVQPAIQTASMPLQAPAKSDAVQPASVTPAEPKADAPVPVIPGGEAVDPSTPGTTTDPSAVQSSPVPEPKPEPVITLRVDINLSTQRMTVKSGGQVLHNWAISSGRSGYLTPRGTFKPQWKARMWYSRQYDSSPMPYSVFFNRGIATHGTSATGMLGRPASHGCVRLTTSNAKAFYNLVGKHGMQSTQIVVRGTTPATPVARKSRRQWQMEAERRQRPRRGYAYGGYGSYYGSPWWAY